MAELRQEARRAHEEAIAGNADFAEVAKIWMGIQVDFTVLYLAWFLPRSTGAGLALAKRATNHLNSKLWSPIPIRPDL